nr:hypothetical protein GCM10020093_060840 [Planobispora longispora]
MIRTLQQRVVALQQEDEKLHGDPEAYIKVFQECTVTRLLKTGDKAAGGAGKAGASSPAPSATGGRTASSSCSTPPRWCWPPAASASPTWSPPTPGSTPGTATRWRCWPGRS